MKTADKHCITCMRGPAYREGCSHVDCPHRKTITAQPVGGTFIASSKDVLYGIAKGGGIRREPTNKE